MWWAGVCSSMPSALLVGLTFYAAAGGFLFGYDLGNMPGALELVRNDTDLSLTDQQTELIVGQTKAGAAFGALVATYLLGRSGHVASFWAASICFVTGPLLIASARDWLSLAGGRLLVGVGIGVSAVASPTYLADIAPHASRGCMVRLFEP